MSSFTPAPWHWSWTLLCQIFYFSKKSEIPQFLLLFFVWFLPFLSIFPMISHVFPDVSWLVNLAVFFCVHAQPIGSQLSTQPLWRHHAFRLTYRRQCRYNTKRNKQHLGQSYGGEGGGVVIFDPHWTHIRLFYMFNFRYVGLKFWGRVVKTPGGRAVFQTLKKKAKGPHCGDCSSVDSTW